MCVRPNLLLDRAKLLTIAIINVLTTTTMSELAYYPNIHV